MGRTGERLVEMLRVTNPLNHRVYSAQRLRRRQVVEQCCSPDEFVFLKPARHSTPNRGLNTNKSARGFMTGARQSWSERQHTAASRQKLRQARGTPNCEGKHLFFNELQRFFFLKKKIGDNPTLVRGRESQVSRWNFNPQNTTKNLCWKRNIQKSILKSAQTPFFLRKSNNTEEGERHHSGKKWLLTQNMRLGARADAQAWARAQHWQFKLIQTQRKSKWKPNFSWPSAHCGVSRPSQKDNRGC